MGLLLELAILLAIADGQKHGYGIYKQLLEDNQAGFITSDLVVYRELPRLMKHGLIEVVHPASKPVQYRITSNGRQRLRFERGQLRRLEELFRQRL